MVTVQLTGTRRANGQVDITGPGGFSRRLAAGLTIEALQDISGTALAKAPGYWPENEMQITVALALDGLTHEITYTRPN